MVRSESSHLKNAEGLLRQNKLAAAEAACREALAQSPDEPEALSLLGDVYMRGGRAGRATRLYRRALKAALAADKEVVPILLALSGALQAGGDAEGATRALNEALEVEPDSVDARFARAGLAWSGGNRTQAMADLRFVVQRRPDHVRAVSNLGAALRETGDLDEAIRVMRPLERAGVQDPMLLYNYGLVLKDVDELDKAIECLERSLSVQPDNLNAYILLVSSLITQSRLAEAEAAIEAALTRWPDNTAMLSYRGSARLAAGDRDGALSWLRRALQSDSRCLPAQGYFAEAGGDMDDPAWAEQIESILLQGNLQPHESALLYFAAGRRRMALGQDDRAFEHFEKGNAAKRASLSKLGKGYDAETEEFVVEELIRGFPKESFGGPHGSESDIPVFVVGMPRSGTSLVEQILASHPEVYGAGELNLINREAVRLRIESGYPLNAASADELENIAAGYLDYLSRLGGGALRITDKMPTNFRNLGLIAQLFPNARIIHTRRDPMDTCFSCFMQNFQGTGNAFIYDLDWLAHYYELYLKLMEHWRSVLPVRLLEVDYEALVADQEAESRKLVEFLGLQWDDSCLDFHKTQRAVVTASSAQVRQPMYRTSVGQWKRFEKQLKGLAERLDVLHGSSDPPTASMQSQREAERRASMTQNELIIGANPQFSDLLHPVTEQDFFADYHGKKFLHIEGGARKFENVMSWEILTGILNQTAIWSSQSLMLVLDNDVVAESAYCEPVTNRDGVEIMQPDAGKVMALLRRGASIVANDIDSLSPVMASVAATLENRLAGKVQANLYCSWRERQAFGSHFDTHDVFAVHVAGEKLWNIYETRMDDPIAHPKFKSFGQEWHDRNRGEIAAQVLMRPGDLLYIPRGQYHDAMATSDGTIHIAFGITHVIGLDVLEMVKATVVDDPTFRRNMPRPEQGEAAVSAWLAGLGDSIGELLRSPEAVSGMVDFQRKFRYPRGGIRLPVHAAGRRYRLTAKGLSVIQKDGQWLLSGKKGSVAIPEGQESVVSWIVDRPAFTEGELTETFPDMDKAYLQEILQALAGMKVVSSA